MDKPYDSYESYEYQEDIKYNRDIEYNYSNSGEEEISRETMKFLLTLMIFMSCLPSLIQVSKSLLKSCKDCYNIKKINIRKIKSNDDLLSDLLDNNRECSICLEEYNQDDKVASLTCGHNYHWKCIKLWLKENNTCPICRENII